MPRAIPVPTILENLKDQDISHISGNGSDNLKKLLSLPTEIFTYVGGNYNRSGYAYGGDIVERMIVKEVWFGENREESRRMELKVVYGLKVTKDMLNIGWSVHGGCLAFLVDICTAMSMLGYTFQVLGTPRAAMSQSLNVVYHSPAILDDDLRIVCTSVSSGARAATVRAEIWNDTHHRLVASGVHIQMEPSSGPLKDAKL